MNLGRMLLILLTIFILLMVATYAISYLIGGQYLK